jgi:thioredoxin reductase
LTANDKTMASNNTYDAIIIGGSYSGLSAAMALGRALRQVLIIDSGQPCNRQTPHSHNFITQDGKTPSEIALLAKQQVEKYNTVTFYDGIALSGEKTKQGFTITTADGKVFFAKKLIFATGIKDIMPDIKGISECWGISVLHCPYCHGYEIKQAKTGILGNGEYAFDFTKLISNWTQDLTLFTNGKITLEKMQIEKIISRNVKIIEKEIVELKHHNGQITALHFKDGSEVSIEAIYTKVPFVQHCNIPEQLDCEISELGYLKIDAFQKTTVTGIFACGDNATPMRTVSNSVAMGTLSGVMCNKEMIEEAF